MRILVFTPVYGEYLSECRVSVLGQIFSGEWQHVIDTDDPYPPPDHRNVLAKYLRAKALTLAGGYDALLTVEQDMVLPVDAVERLAAVQAGVVFGVYVLRHGARVINAWRYDGDRNLGMSLSLYPHELRRLRMAGEAVRVSGVGWGCTLIRREVLARAWLHDGGGTCPAGDIPFAQWCLHNGVEMRAHFGVQCGHVDEEGRMLKVNENLDMRKVEALQRVNVASGGQAVSLEPGRRYLLEAGAIDDLVRAGYVREIAIERAVSVPDGESVPGVEHAVTEPGKKRRRN